MLVGEDAVLAHLDVEEKGVFWVKSEAPDEGVVSEDIGAAYLVENGESISGREGMKKHTVKEYSCEE